MTGGGVCIWRTCVVRPGSVTSQAVTYPQTMTSAHLSHVGVTPCHGWTCQVDWSPPRSDLQNEADRGESAELCFGQENNHVPLSEMIGLPSSEEKDDEKPGSLFVEGFPSPIISRPLWRGVGLRCTAAELPPP